MKKYKLYLLLAALVGLTASCSRDAEESGLQTTDNSTVSIGASIDPGVRTRADGDGAYTIPDNFKLRYVLEVWSTGDDAKVIHREEQTATDLAGVNFNFKLEQTGKYQALLWADFTAMEYKPSQKTIGSVTYDHYSGWFYTTTNGLKQIAKKLFSHSYETADAFFACLDIEKEAGAYNKPVTLNRPFGQVNIIEKDATLADKVTAVRITYKAPKTFDVSTGTPGEMGECGSYIHNYRPTPSGARKANLGYIYVFAPAEGQTLMGEITLGFTAPPTSGISFPDFTIPANMPVERNHRTNISGTILSETAVPSADASLSVSLSTGWETTDVEKDVDPKVGDYYYKDGTWSSDLNTTAENPVIGVIWKVNDDGKTGSVVSLNEPTDLAWAVAAAGEHYQKATGATSSSDGKGNTDKVFAYISENGEDITNYPIFEACKKQRDDTGNDGWYIPAMYNDLFYPYSGTSVAEQINAKIAAANGTELVAPTGESDAYWTSEENSGTGAIRQTGPGQISNANKGNKHRVRFWLDF